MTGGVQAINAQNSSPPLQFADKAEPMDATALDEQRFLHSVVQAVIHLEATGERTMDAIENSQITLTFDSMPDTSRLSLLCVNDAKALNAFAQSVAGELQLSTSKQRSAYALRTTPLTCR